MDRITVKSENGYELSEGVSLEKVIEKLASFENNDGNIRKILQNFYFFVKIDLHKGNRSHLLHEKYAKNKDTATYRQLFAEKLKLNEMKNRIDFWF